MTHLKELKTLSTSLKLTDLSNQFLNFPVIGLFKAMLFGSIIRAISQIFNSRDITAAEPGLRRYRMDVSFDFGNRQFLPSIYHGPFPYGKWILNIHADHFMDKLYPYNPFLRGVLPPLY
jgi:hypothetical protein